MTNITPQLVKQTSLAKVTQLETRVNLLVASAASELSPVVVYLEGAVPEVSVNGSTSAAGTWTCPAGLSTVQAECWAAGGGGGGGTPTNGGGGGGGGEYACEPSYAVIPGNTYTFAVGRAGQGGVSAGQGGWPGGNTIFDTTAGGVTANGGGGGDGATNINGGTGSANTLHFNGGNGGVSSAGIASDNPSTVQSLLMWWRMDDNNGNGGVITRTNDATGHDLYGAVLNPEKGPPVLSGLVATASAAPAQAPTQTISGTSTKGSAAYFKQDPANKTTASSTAPVFGLGNGNASPQDGSKLTVSCWIRADTTLNSWGSIPAYGHQYSTLLSNCNYVHGINTGYAGTDSSGFALFLMNGAPCFYLNDHTISSAGRTAVGSALAVNSTWHQVVGTWDGTTMSLYVDGALVNTQTPGFSKFAEGTAACVAGMNPVTKADSVFTGYMSNLWLAASTVNSSYISEAYGASPALGGSGGGASGGSAGAGNSGTSATSSTGGAAGSSASGTGTTGGSGAGGAGGNSGANGASAPVTAPYGGGGGGAGAPSSTATVSLLPFSAQHSASYAGIDAQGGNNGVLYDVSDFPQAGTPSVWPSAAVLSSNMYAGGDPSTPFNGSLNSVAVFQNLKATLAGQTVNSATITLTVQSLNASVLPVGFGWCSDIPVSLGSDTDIANYLTSYTPLVTISVPAGAAGRQVTLDITNSALISALQANGTGYLALVFGGLQGSPTYGLDDGAYDDADSYAWNTVFTGAGATDPTTDLSITLEVYPSTGSNKTGGDAAPGALILSYIDPRYWPVVAVQPAITTDSDGHTFAAGVTTDSIVGFDPTVVVPPRVPETWHSLGTLTSGSGITVDTARYRYSPEDGGTVVIQFAGHNTSLVTGGYAFAVILPASLRPSVSSSGSNDLINIPLVNSGGSPPAISCELRVYGKNSSTSPGQVSIQISSSPVSAYNLYACVRIPLT